MFEGTLRDNLDPRHAHVDTELWSVLGMSSDWFIRSTKRLTFAEHARLKDYIASMEGQLDAQIQEGGKWLFFFFLCRDRV